MFAIRPLAEGLLSYVGNKIGELLFGAIFIQDNTRRDLEWVQRELRMMDAILEHVDPKKIQDSLITVWIHEVRKLAFHAEDVVDTFSDLDYHTGIPARKSRRINISQSNLKRDFGTEVTQLRERVDVLMKQRETYGINIPDTSSAAGTVNQMDALLQSRRLRAAPYVEDRDVVGLDDHVTKVTELLDREESRRSVVSIVGMGGLGKTTLVKKVYNNKLTSSSFDCTAWVDVSQKYNIPDLLKKIAQDTMKLSSEDVGKMDQGTVPKKLYEFIQSKKYLIVLDDVWTSELWKLLDNILPDPENGSRIIITTRNIEVAKSANPSLSPYELSTLGDVESRVLFTKKVFAYEENPEQCCTEELASLRKQILKQCGGLPLAIIVVGGLLSTKEKTPKEWSEVADNIDWYQTKTGEQCMGILALSYIDLPVHLRRCFLHLASIPEDCEALVNRLQRLWIGEGFIEEKAGRSCEEMAERYLEELVSRCLIQVVEKPFGNDFQRPERYFPFQRAERCIRVHDLLLELAVSEAKKIRFLDTWRCDPNASPGELIRRLSFTPDRTHLSLGSNKLRTLLIMDRDAWRLGEIVKGPRIPYLGMVIWSSLEENLKLLRVLHLSVYIDGLLEGIGDLVNLRYLAISCNSGNKLPGSVGNLRHLQTLDLEMARVDLLPNTIWQIKTLRYLRGNGMHTELSPMPDDCLPGDTFENLRALRNVRWSLSMEKIFPYLTNLEELELPIYTFHVSPVLLSSIKKMQRLRVLILNAMRNDFRDTFVFKMDETFLPSNSHPYLHTLMANSISVEASQLQSLPQELDRVGLYVDKIDRNTIKLLGNLNHLHRLELADISSIEEKKEMVFRSGWFPQLHVLHLYHLKIEKWKMEGQTLPLLRELHIEGCERLEALPEGLWHISTLRVFELVDSYWRLHQRLQKPEGGFPPGEDWPNIKDFEYVHIFKP